MITEEHRRHLSESHMGIKRTPEALAKFRKSMKKRWADPEFKIKMIESFKGRIVSEETRRKISKAHLSISGRQEADIIKLYKNVTADEISLKLNLNRAVVYSCLHRHKIQMRPIGIRMGKIPWNKDLELSEEQKAKLNMEGLKIGHPWNKGKTGIYSEEHLKQMSDARKGKYTGEKASNWRGGISYGHKTGYYSSQYKEWRKAIFERDNYTCQDCGIHASEVGYLTAHHIKSFAKYPKLRFEINNGNTLCEQCHSQTDNYRGKSKMEVN